MICTDEEVLLGIADNGEGFDIASVASTSLGLGIMRERAESIGAFLDIKSQTGKGTEILVSWNADQREAKSE